MAPKQMSLEAALQEEANDIMALLEGRKNQSPTATTSRARTQSPATTAPKSPMRSMLDIAPGIPRDQHLAGRANSIAGEGIGTGRSPLVSPTGSTFSEPGGAYRGSSMLDLGAPSGHARGHRPSHGSTSPGLPTIHQGLASPRLGQGQGIESEYKFEMLPSIDSHAMPKRNTQGEKLSFSGGSGGAKKRPNSLSAVFGNEGGKKQSSHSGQNKSRSPGPSHGGLRSGRSQSPATRNLNSNSMNLMSTPGTYVSDSGKVINLDQAYRRLSDAALLKSGGRLAELPTKKTVNVQRGEELAPDGGVRLTKDYDEDEALDTSDEDGSVGTSDDEGRARGRARARKGSEQANSPRQVKSLLAAAEEERKDVQSQTKVRSMLDVSAPGLSAEQLFSKKLEKPVIHPRTSYDEGRSSSMGGARSGISTPMDSDEEQNRTDFNTAQKMALTLSPIHSSPEAHRCIRQILRGDFRKYQEEAEQGLRRQRMYLVATDLSEEAAYALEWTIGTVLRDGDTLLAVYAVDEETGTAADPTAVANSNSNSSTSNSVAIGEGPKQMSEAAAIVRTLSNQQGLVVPGELRGRASTDGARSQSGQRSHSKGVYKDKAEKERYHATQEITDRCIKLLRKTKLQVRVVVEVFHCKSPRHMITEVIDYLEPTLVILGSRGRSALKGVLLGSFSNYLVTKSSVPVMVARKKLRKHSKFKGLNPRLSNMLQTPGNRLEAAVIDRPNMGTRRGSQGVRDFARKLARRQSV